MTRTTARTARTRLAHTFAIALVCLVFALPAAGAPTGDAAPFADARAVVDALWAKVQAWAMEALKLDEESRPLGVSSSKIGADFDRVRTHLRFDDSRDIVLRPIWKIGPAPDPHG